MSSETHGYPELTEEPLVINQGVRGQQQPHQNQVYVAPQVNQLQYHRTFSNMQIILHQFSPTITSPTTMSLTTTTSLTTKTTYQATVKTTQSTWLIQTSSPRIKVDV